MFAAFCTTFSSCETLSGVVSFVNCKYEFTGLSNPGVAGISLGNINNVQNLNATSMLKLTAGIMSGSLPMSFTVNIKATNPNATAAQIAGLDWAIDLNTSNILTGNLNSPVSIAANGGTTVIPINIETDLLKLFKNESKDNILKFVNSLLNMGEGSSDITFRIRPAVIVGGQKISTGFISLTKNVN
ncbi:MAG: LEA type 2 family protein [Prevotellaceae bacterium]|nr:LEA type 2 family protein [Prevotellaceae bacterium]